MEYNIKFKCEGDNLEVIPDNIVNNTGITFPKAHTENSLMCYLAKELKNYKKDSICRVPFCVTVEAEALGGNIKLGDMKNGPRVESYAFTTIEELGNIKNINFQKGRINEVLEAVEKLTNEGECVALTVEGPFTILSSIIDPMIFYKGIRKNKEKIDEFLMVLEDNIVSYIIEGIKRGAKIISYGDPVGSLDIVGPKVYEQYSGRISHNILKRVEPYLENAVVHLCGKTSTAFEKYGLSVSKAIEFEGELTYGEAINKILQDRKNVKFIGNACIKRTPFIMKNSVAWEIKLL
ncbi:methylcobamide--CoM methyltransferase [Clostridium estertheticum]|uniref:uroporphyrinogen decarboxylase family protein n=1 Tax=Clostridium estertheticum TaxID=238834 RepID=UPI00192439EC|nr:uroporphyrinogen decarboxylase family protein [Clostridium estertheticum]MBZ9686184.1 methylcobamide--CoM methyltransferase [Clostridium estertheticum]